MIEKIEKENSAFFTWSSFEEGLKAVAPADLHLSCTRDEYLAVSPLSISLRSVCGGGAGGLGVVVGGGSAATLEKQATHRNDCVIIAVIANLDHTGVECQISSGLTGGGCGAGLWGPDGPPAPAEGPRVWDSHNSTSWCLRVCQCVYIGMYLWNVLISWS